MEEWKWDIPVWSQGGIICTGETYKGKVKLTFAKGAALADPKKTLSEIRANPNVTGAATFIAAPP